MGDISGNNVDVTGSEVRKPNGVAVDGAGAISGDETGTDAVEG